MVFTERRAWMKRGIALIVSGFAVLSVVLPATAQTLSQEIGLTFGSPAFGGDAALQKAIEFIGANKAQKVDWQTKTQFTPRHRAPSNTIITGGSEAFPM
jgi:hypothetical protein